MKEEKIAKVVYGDHTEVEEDFYHKLNDIVDNTDKLGIIQSPFLYATRQQVTTFFTRFELYKLTQESSIKGSFVECGTNHGNSLMMYYHFLSIFEPYATNKKIIAFDSFAGFPSIHEMDKPNAKAAGEVGDLQTRGKDYLQNVINTHDKNRAVSHISKVELVQGDASKTIPKYVKDNPELVISFLYLDFDLYEPTVAALKYLLPLVPKGGLVGFDELASKRWPGETTAVKELLDLNNIEIKTFQYDPNVSYFIV